MKTAARRIVCATDFSTNARRAGDVAGAIARRLGVTCELVHVADPFHSHTEGTKEFARAMRLARGSLHTEARRIGSSSARVDEVLLHSQLPELAIEAFLARIPPLFAVVSSVSKSAFDRWTLGSVSEHVAEHSPVPTLVVRMPERLLGWVRGERPLKVVVGVDFTVSSDAALAALRQLQRVADCAVTVVHIRGATDDAPRAAVPLGAFQIFNSREAQQRMVRSLRRKIGEVVGAGVALRLESNWGRADAALVNVAHEIDADLVIVGTHQRHGVGRLIHPSFSRGILRHAPCNVLCVATPLAVKHGIGGHPRIDRVLVATDLSPSGDQAIPWAYAAVAPGGVVKLVHVVEPWTLPSPLMPRYERSRIGRSAHRRLVGEARAKLAALVPLVGVPQGVTTQMEVLDDGDVARGIGIAAQSLDPSLICLTAKPRTAAAGTLFGSVVRKVVEQNPVPVLLVRPREE